MKSKDEKRLTCPNCLCMSSDHILMTSGHDFYIGFFEEYRCCECGWHWETHVYDRD